MAARSTTTSEVFILTIGKVVVDGPKNRRRVDKLRFSGATDNEHNFKLGRSRYSESSVDASRPSSSKYEVAHNQVCHKQGSWSSISSSSKRRSRTVETSTTVCCTFIDTIASVFVEQTPEDVSCKGTRPGCGPFAAQTNQETMLIPL